MTNNWIENTYQFLSFSDPNLQFVLAGLIIMGAASGLVGCFMLLRNQALIGDAISHSILPGICFAFIISGTKNPVFLIIGATIAGWLSIFGINYIVKNSKLKSDAAIGIVLSGFFGLGILLLSFIQNSGNANQSGLDKFLFGNAAAIVPQEAKVIAFTAALVLVVCILFLKAFKIIAFNYEFAKVSGLPVQFFDFVLNTLVVLTISTGIQTIGIVLMSALLITPAAAARFWTYNLSKMLIISAFSGAISGFLGAYISYLFPSMPTGPWVVIVLSAFAILSILFAPEKGVLARYFLNIKNKRKIVRENILKALYQMAEVKSTELESYSKSQISDFRGFTKDDLNKGLNDLMSLNLAFEINGRFELTQKGLEEAKKITRLHRLWELYLTQRFNFESDHVHGMAETMEHLITPEIEAILSKELNFPETDPHNKIIPY